VTKNTQHVAFLQHKNELLKEAQTAREFADSYRNYKVGAAALAWNSKTKEYSIYRGCNLKPVNPGEKMCAERIAVGAAKSYGSSKVVALAIVGEPQDTTTLTLHPCISCLEFLSTVKGCDEDTIVLTEWNGVEEVHTIKKLLHLHRNGIKTVCTIS